jgi:hypothetical protein
MVMMMLDRNPFHFSATCNRWSTCQGGRMGRQVWLPWPLRYSESTAPCQNLTCRVQRSREIKNMSRDFKRDIRYPMIFRHAQTMSIEFTMQTLSYGFHMLPQGCVSAFILAAEIRSSQVQWIGVLAARNPARDPPTRTKSPALRQIIWASELMRCPICWWRELLYPLVN